MARKPTLSEKQVEEIIGLYKTSHNSMGQLEYMDVYRFNQELYRNGIVAYSMSDDFWRKKGRIGRIKIDEANELFKHKLVASDEKQIVITNITDIVNRYKNDINKLVTELLPLQEEIFNSIQRENKLKQENDKLHEQLNLIKVKNYKLNNQVTDLEETLFKVFRFSSNDNIPITNFLETGSTESIIVKKALDSMFEKPIDFIQWFNTNHSNHEDIADNNVVSLIENNSNKRVSRLIKDRYED